jgi:hypothetical protein
MLNVFSCKVMSMGCGGRQTAAFLQQIEECGSLPRSRYAGFAEVSYYLSAWSILLPLFPIHRAHPRTLSPERGCVPQSGTSRSSFAKPACWNTPDAAKLFHVLRLVLCTQPRSSPVAIGGSARMRPDSCRSWVLTMPTGGHAPVQGDDVLY